MARWMRSAGNTVAVAAQAGISAVAASAHAAATTPAAAAPPESGRATTAVVTVGRFRKPDSLVPLLFMASGAAALIYQVVWTQDLVLVFGDTTLAIVTTVTAFLAGLGIGALVGAAVAARLRRALAVYGLLEAAVGILALLMPLAFDFVATVFRSAYISLAPAEVALIRFGLAFVALTPVTLLMGMSLPVLTRHLVRTDPDIGERIARLYGLNTLGAVLGCIASGYFLIELIGLRGTTFVAVSLNLVAGLGALAIFRSIKGSPAESPAESAVSRSPLRRRQWLMLGVTFVSGLVSLALEVLWTRVMLQGTGSSIYVFIAVISVFLIGIATGSLIYERGKDRPAHPATLGVLLGCAAGLALIPLIVSNVGGPASLPLAVFLILPVTGILGYTFPLTVRLFVESAAQASRGVGFVYAVNTAGCVVGSVSAGFLLIPYLGPSGGIIAVCLLQVVIGTGLAIVYVRPRAWIQPFLAGIVAVVIAVMAVVPAARLTYIQRTVLPGTPTAHFDDSVASVDPEGGPPEARRLLINGVGITRLTIATKLLAYIPKAARPGATSMLNICFGMGSTFRSSIILGLHTTAVELDPTVPKVMHWFYSDASQHLHSPLAHIIISDGRNYVRLSNKRYDLITIDAPPPLWGAGAVVLITREFYQEAVQRLTPGGVLTSFVPYYNPKLLLRTFRGSFRYVKILLDPIRRGGMYMMGSQRPILFSRSSIMKVFGTPAARADLAGAPDFRTVATRAWPRIIYKLVWLRSSSQVRRFAGRGPLLTDDHPLIEYFLLSKFGAFAPTEPVYEQAAVETSLVVLSLLALLAVGLAVFGRVRRHRDRPSQLPGDRA